VKKHFYLIQFIIFLFFSLYAQSQGPHCLLLKGDHIDTLNTISVRYYDSKKFEMEAFRSKFKSQQESLEKIKLTLVTKYKNYSITNEYFYFEGGLIDSSVYILNFKPNNKRNKEITKAFGINYFFKVGNDFNYISKSPIKAMFSPEFLNDTSLNKHYILVKLDRQFEKEGIVTVSFIPILLTPNQYNAIKSGQFKLED